MTSLVVKTPTSHIWASLRARTWAEVLPPSSLPAQTQHWARGERTYTRACPPSLPLKQIGDHPESSRGIGRQRPDAGWHYLKKRSMSSCRLWIQPSLAG